VALNLVVMSLVLWVIVRRLDTIGEAMRRAAGTERREAAGSDVAPEAAAGAGSPLDAVRDALEADDVARAQTLLEGLKSQAADRGGPDIEALESEVSRRKEAAVGRLRASLEAARSVGDPDSVLDLHGRLVLLVSQVEREALEREQVRWFVALLMRRMRSGTVRGDVALLAEKVAEAFAAHPEGASLRASLPTLRRSAGLCATCGEPYGGIEDACPECLQRKALAPEGASHAWAPPAGAEPDDFEGDAAMPDELLPLEQPAAPPGNGSAT
jgi:hypothetical protein